MALDPLARKIWIETQKKYDEPVNAIGLKIKPTDQITLSVWKNEQIDRYMKQKIQR